MAGAFAFETCLLKHYVRLEVWLPHSKERLNRIRKAVKSAAGARRLKYFTFCAVGALDVLLLDRAKIIRRSAQKEFDTVYFFDTDEDSVIETRKRIPGAVGFPGDFVKVVLQDEPEEVEGTVVDELDSPANKENTRAVRQKQNALAQLQKFKQAFPFDVMNFDVEQYLFHPKEELPGRLMAALRKIFEWQTREGIDSNGKSYSVDEFSLMFTTSVGPKNLSKPYVEYLRDTCLQGNLEKYPELVEPFNAKSGGKDVKKFFEDDFDGAFKLAVPKSLIELALENDWHIEGKDGIEVYEFDREAQEGSYTMLHMAMTVRRQKPAMGKRAPGQKLPADAEAEHRAAIVQLFSREVVAVENLVAGSAKDQLEADLNDLFEHRSKFYKEEEGEIESEVEI
jgi:hypothetical protein